MDFLPKLVVYLSIFFIFFFAQSKITASDFDQAGRCNPLNFNWRFHLGEAFGAYNPGFDDSEWRLLNVPHDWSIEGKFDSLNASCTGFLPGGIGWYRKEFNLPETYKSKQIEIQFDGVYQNSEVWINGHYLGKRPYGFISFYYNLTPYLNLGNEENVIAVRVDHTHIADARWYTGSGIYRNVWLYITDQIYITRWGTYVTTPEVNKDSAQVRIITSIENNSSNKKSVILKSIIKDGDGNIAGQASSNIPFQPGTKYDYDQDINIKQPVLWSLNNPYLYSVISEVYNEGQLLDRDSVSFGVRTFRFDAETGFYLNGESTLIKGVCLHNDAGALGAAVPKREWERRLLLMKEMGANAVRTSHNPPAPEFLDLCDQMGFLVMDEAFDEWEIGKKKWMKGWNVGQDQEAAGLGTYYSQNGYGDFFHEWSKTDLQDMIRRDRNHPSIILWSIGNEIDYPNDPYTDPTRPNYQPWRPAAYQLTEIARRLYEYVKEMDTTRPVTAALANIPLSNQTGYAALLDVVGYNYQEQYYDQDHKQFPKRKMLGSENGDSYDAWLSVKDNKFISAQFLWTGIDYLGEAGSFPNRSNLSGLVDLSDYKKPGFYYRKSLWTDEPMVYISAISPEDSLNRYRFNLIESWNWEDYSGKNIPVLVFTNCDSVELFFQPKADQPSAENDNSLGIRSFKGTKHAMLNWEVPFNPGTLKALAYKNGKAAAEYVLKTAGKPDKIILDSDRSSIYADGKDIASVKVLVMDRDGNIVPYADNQVTINITGAGFNAGFGNGDNQDLESYKSNLHKVFKGKAHVFIQSSGEKGVIQIEAMSEGLGMAKLSIDTK
jgi:beta-galactosidase